MHSETVTSNKYSTKICICLMQGSMDYMGASTQLPGQTGQYGSQYGLPQQYQQQQHYGAAVQQAASQQVTHPLQSSPCRLAQCSDIPTHLSHV